MYTKKAAFNAHTRGAPLWRRIEAKWGVTKRSINSRSPNYPSPMCPFPPVQLLAVLEHSKGPALFNDTTRRRSRRRWPTVARGPSVIHCPAPVPLCTITFAFTTFVCLNQLASNDRWRLSLTQLQVTTLRRLTSEEGVLRKVAMKTKKWRHIFLWFPKLLSRTIYPTFYISSSIFNLFYINWHTNTSLLQ